MALEKMLKAAPDEEAKAPLQWALNDLKAKSEPAKVDEAVLKRYVGRYAEGAIALENGNLYILAMGGKIKLIPLSPTYFVPEDDSEIQVEFVLGPEGKEYDAVGYFRYGGKERYNADRGKEVRREIMRRPLFAAVIICLVLFQAGWAQAPDQEDFKDNPVLPQGIQGQRIQSLIDTLNSGDRGTRPKILLHGGRGTLPHTSSPWTNTSAYSWDSSGKREASSFSGSAPMCPNGQAKP